MNLRRILWSLWVLYTAAHFAYSIAAYNPITHPVSANDLRVTFLEAQHWSRTGELILMGVTNVYYGLLYYLFLSLFAACPFPLFVAVSYLSQFLLFPAFLFLLMRSVLGGRVRVTEILLVAVLTLNFQPFLEAFTQCKVESLEFYLICLIFYAFGRRWNGVAAAAVVSATALKYLPGFLGIYFLLKREWPVVRWMGACGLMLAALLAAAFGWRVFWEVGVEHFLGLVFSPRLDTNVIGAVLEWQTLSNTVHRLFATLDPGRSLEEFLEAAQFTGVRHPRLVYGIVLVLKSLAAGATLWTIRRRLSSTPRQSLGGILHLEMSLTLVMMVMGVQAVRIHHAILLLPAFLTVALLLFRHRSLFGRPEKLLFGVGYALSAVLIPGGLLNRLPPSPLWGQSHARMYYWASLPFYGYLLLFLCILLCHRRLRSRHGSAA